MYKVKVAVVGPSQAGKTMISNFLADATDNIGGDYRPTVGVRILEFESPGISVNGSSGKAEVELWDCGGGEQQSACWPAIQRGAQGVVLVFNPESQDQARQLDALHEAFVRAPGLQESNCVVFAHFLSLNRDRRGAQLSHKFSKIPQLEVNLEDEGARLRTDFQTFLSTVVEGMSQNRDQEEISIIRGK